MRLYKRVNIGLLLLLAVVSTGCFNKYIKTEAQLQAHFAQQTFRPNYHQIDTLGRKLAYAHIGYDSLPLVVFVHGAPGSWYGYLNLMSDSMLQQHFQMISIDRPGYGASDYGYPLTRLKDQALMLQALLQRYKAHRPILLVGRSYGSPVVAQLAADYPELVDGCLLLAPALDPKKEKFWWFSPLGLLDGVRNLLPNALNVATDEKYSHRRELRQLAKDLSKIQTPTTVVQGGKDKLVHPDNLHYAGKKMSEAPIELIFLPDDNHHISHNRPELVKQLLFKHLNDYQKHYSPSPGQLGGR